MIKKKFRQWVLGEEPDFCDNTRSEFKSMYNDKLRAFRVIILPIVGGLGIGLIAISFGGFPDWIKYTLDIIIACFGLFIIFNIFKCTLRRMFKLFMKKD